MVQIECFYHGNSMPDHQTTAVGRFLDYWHKVILLEKRKVTKRKHFSTDK